MYSVVVVPLHVVPVHIWWTSDISQNQKKKKKKRQIIMKRGRRHRSEHSLQSVIVLYHRFKVTKNLLVLWSSAAFISFSPVLCLAHSISICTYIFFYMSSIRMYGLCMCLHTEFFIRFKLLPFSTFLFFCCGIFFDFFVGTDIIAWQDMKRDLCVQIFSSLIWST